MSGSLRNRFDGTTLRGCAAAALLCLLAACASAPAPTTVAKADPKNGDGIGGTGIRGTITGFGSILVNGLKLDFDHKTIVVSDGKPVSLEALRVGQLVQGVAHTTDGKLSLATLEIQHAVSGPVGVIDYASETLTVLGQKVRVNLAGESAAIAAFKTLQTGDIVSVSGLRQADGTIVASRVDQTYHDDRVIVRGTASAATPTEVRVGDIEIQMPAGTTPLQTGAHVFAAGRMINGKFVSDVVSYNAPLPFGDDVTSVSLEAFAPTVAGAGPLVIDGVSVSGATLPTGTAVNDRVIVTGQIAGPTSVTATNISAARTVVTINAARGSVRPATIRPEGGHPERIAPRPSIDRPQAVKPETPSTSRPTIERPQGVPMV
jgi:Domain of unknown function (DUF5666)